jgi:hypothetical protein
MGLSAALAGRPAGVVRTSVDRLLTSIKKLPVGVRRKLPAQQTLRRTLTSQVRGELERVLPELKILAQALAVAPLDLNVEVRRAELALVPESLLQEITLQIATDDLRAAEPIVSSERSKA